MLSINLYFIQNQKNTKKGIDDICATSYKTRKIQKKELTIYVILATKPEKYKKRIDDICATSYKTYYYKKCIHDICCN